MAAQFDQVGAERGEAPMAATAADASGGTSLYLRCGDDGPSFPVRVESEQAELSLSFGNVRLAKVKSEQGTKYSDGKFTLWRDGDSAKYQDDQGRKFDCKNDSEQATWSDARRRGVEMRAVGPDRDGWVLEMTLTGTSLFMGDESETIDIVTPSPKGYLESEEESYWGRDEDEYTLLRVTRVDEECMDPRTGQKFDMRVEVSLNGHTMEGCGRNLRDRPYER
jgi:membrane-bound inhibitor of C-type lysozyme